MRIENLTKEKDMLRQAESRLTREKEAMLAEQRNQNLLLTNLKTIQVPALYFLFNWSIETSVFPPSFNPISKMLLYSEITAVMQ